MLFLESQYSHRRFTESMRLRFENAAIAEERHRALVYAEHSNAAKTRFLASVSHELRTPLNGIIGMTQLVAVEPLSTLQRQRLDVLRHSAEHLVTVIGDLLDLSRIEFDRIELNPQPTLIAQTVRDVTDLLQPVAEERGLAFEVVFDLGLPAAALMDASRVKQVLHNLIGNALKFTAHGSVGLAVAMSDGLLRFRVSDSGEGIPPDAIERIFDAFEQGPSSTAPARSGAGLGLTISRRLARAMGGDVTCRSVPGVGTTFEFTIAFRPTPKTPTPRPSLSEELAAAGETSAEPVVRPGRVLVVEDNEVNALVVRGMLEQMGVNAELAVDGQKALARMGQTALRPGADGLPDARPRRLGGDAPLARARDAPAPEAARADRRADRQRRRRRARALPRGRHGRLPQQAVLARGAGRVGRSLPRGLTAMKKAGELALAGLHPTTFFDVSS